MTHTLFHFVKCVKSTTRSWSIITKTSSCTTLCLAQELIVHPFWQTCMTALSMPPEPALESFVKAYKLAPVDANPRASMASQSAVRVLSCHRV